jgi:hypothetical protein
MLTAMSFNRLAPIALLLLTVSFISCAQDDNSHTTVTTIVPAPPRQVLTVSQRPSAKVTAKPAPELQVDPAKAFAVFEVTTPTKTDRGVEVVVDFALANAKLKGDGGEYRVRYIVDDDEMKWIDRWEQTVFTGWTPGEHSIRLELIGPDEWPFYNGNTNVVTKKLTIEPPRK